MINIKKTSSIIDKTCILHWLYNFDFKNIPNISIFTKLIEIGKLPLNIDFSNEIIYKSYGFLTIEDFKEYVKDNYHINEDIFHLFRDINSREILLRSLEKLAAILAALNDKNRHDVYTELHELAKKLEFNTVVLSSFDYKEKTILFYDEAIKEYATSKSFDPLDVYEYEFCAMLFRYYHYHFIINNSNQPSDKYIDILQRSDYTAKVVKSSLSEYYTLEYCKYYRKTNIGCYLGDISPEIYPAAGCEYIVSWKHFIDLLNYSIDDFDFTLRKLFNKNPEIFYNIKDRIKDIKQIFYKFANRLGSYIIPEEEFLDKFREYMFGKASSKSISDYISNFKREFRERLEMEFNVLFALNKASRVYLVDKLYSTCLSPTYKTALKFLLEFLENVDFDIKGINIVPIK